MNKKTTINDVAREAEVSKKTVSRVINNEANVGPATRSRVKEVIAKLNYSPDPQARGLAFRRSFLLALVYDNPNASFVTDAMYGVLDRCLPAGYELVMRPSNSRQENLADEIIAFVKRLKIDGVILLPPLSEHNELAGRLREAQCQYVRIMSVDDDRPENTVISSDRRAVLDIAEHLVAFGHKDIGIIAIVQQRNDLKGSATLWRNATSNCR